MRGRKPKPEKLKLVGTEGRIIGDTSPGADAPPDLHGEALKEWQRVVPLLQERYLLSPIDSMLLAGYCRACSSYAETQRIIEKDGWLVEASNGRRVLHPLANFSNGLLAEIRKMASEFGFSPAARSRISVPSKETAEDKALAEFLG